MNEKGITLVSLIIYIITTIIILTILSMISTNFYKNIKKVEYGQEYALEFNKFNMFFIEDVKKNHTASINNNIITFEDGTKYEWNRDEKVIYRNNEKINTKINNIIFNINEEKSVKNNTTKQIISVTMNTGKKNVYEKTIDYVLKYW